MDTYALAEKIARDLYPHQVEGLAFLLGRRRSILADDMGLGKTRQSIHGLTQAVASGPYLVVCPASVKRNWEREILAVLPGAESVVAGPDPPPAPGYDGWVILNYDILKKHVDELLQHAWSGFVFDEAHYLKNHRSLRSRLSTRLVKECAGEPVVHALTGTPLTNRPRDLFPLLQLVDHSLGRSFLGFARRYCDAHKNEYGRWITSGASHIDELAVQLHGIMLRRTKDEVLDLPPKLRTWVEVDVPDTVVAQLNHLARRFLSYKIPCRRTATAKNC
jgi:SWI/SNF-related matrix-associated actin-dependent regulator 1 of chromatin subfamily A